MTEIYHVPYLSHECSPYCLRATAAAQDAIAPSLKETYFTLAATGRDNDSRPSLDMAMMSDSEAVVDGLSNGHDFQDVGQLFKGDAAHSHFSKLYRLMKPGTGDGHGHLMLKSLRISCALLLTIRHKG